MSEPGFLPVELLHRPGAMLRVRPKIRGHFHQEFNHVYAEARGAGLVMDIFRPAGRGNGFGVVDVVSSGWRTDRIVLNEHLGFGLCDAFCAEGFTVFAVSPGSAGLFDGHGLSLHVHAALRHVREHASGWGVDPERLTLAGVSAGGHLAALAALTPQKARPSGRDPYRRHDTSVAAAVLFFPPTDLLDFNGVRMDQVHHPEIENHELLFRGGTRGHSEDEVLERLRELSPVHAAARFAERRPGQPPPPFLLVHGDADPLVPLDQSARLAAALRGAGGHAELLVRRGGGHPWPDPEPELKAAARWLRGGLDRGEFR